MRRFVLLCVSLAVGCAQPPIVLQATFNADEARAMLLPGVNQIRGNAFLRQQGGGVVTCAGSSVYLIPATHYARQRFRAIYGREDGPSVAGAGNAQTFVPDSADYLRLVKETQCDSQGNFVFDRVADGDFYVQTNVVWTVGNSRQGGHLMRRLRVAGGEIVNVVVSP